MRLFAAAFSAFLFLGFSLPSKAHAWGHSTELGESWAQARLVFPVLKNHAVRYCLLIENPKRFPETNIAVQVRAALRAWLEPAINRGLLPSVTLTQVSCRAPDLNLMVHIGHELEYTSLGYYHRSMAGSVKAPYYALVKIDDRFVDRESREAFQIEDLFKLLRIDAAQGAKVLDRLTFTNPGTVSTLAQERGLSYRAVFWTTYPGLLHEIGHAFGLCDTYTAVNKDECDPAWSKRSQPFSVMKSSDFFYLTEDDRQGILTLFRRFMKR